jgi:hypothetical protein
MDARMRLVLLSLALLAVVRLPASAQTNAPAGGIDPDDFAILAWNQTPGDPAILRDMRRCGLNLAGFVRPQDLDAVADAGLRCIVSDPGTRVGEEQARLGEAEIATRVKALVDRVGRHPAVFGYYLCDEPTATLYDGLARWVEAFRRAAPASKPYINLFPNGTLPRRIGVPTYEEYVETFVTIVRPPLISYDKYVLMEDGSMRGGYFENLETIRAAALRHKLPFWNVILSNGHHRYAEPTEAGLRFQVYTTLAYGGRGIGYYTYLTPAHENYRLGPVDPFGHKTPTWHMLRRINLQIHKLAPLYAKLRSTHVFHHPEVPAGGAPATTSRHLGQVSGGSFVVGEFEGPGGQPAVLIVNKSLTQSACCTIKRKTPGAIRLVNAYTGAIGPAGENNWLAPGQGVLLLLGD